MKDSFIPLSTPSFDGRESEYLQECLDSGWVAAGPFISKFEQAVAKYIGAADAVAVSSGTAALHIAMRLMDVGAGDEVVCPSLTFVASTNSIAYTGARPMFLDSQAETWGLDPAEFQRFLEEDCDHGPDGAVTDRKSGLRVKAVMPVHLYGHPVDMDPLIETAREHQIAVIEDATESLGSTYKDGPMGIIGDVGCFSFNGNKTITSGGGGMMVFRGSELVDRGRSLINHAKDPVDEFYHSEEGYNYRTSNLHAAVGLAQLEQLDQRIAARRRNAEQYAEALAEVPGISVVREQAWAKSNYWLSTVLLDPSVFPVKPAEVMSRMREAGIEVRRPFVPNHRLPPYQGERKFGELPTADSLYERGLNLPSSSWMDSNHVERVVEALSAMAVPGASR